MREDGGRRGNVMQVSRKSHRWPFVVALVGLLVFCLTVPKYWRSDAKRLATLDLITEPSFRSSPFSISPLEPPFPAYSPTLEALANDDALFRQLREGITFGAPQAGFPNVSWPTPADVLSLRPRLDLMELSPPQCVLPSWLEPHLANGLATWSG
jgi:hypothetical protein